MSAAVSNGLQFLINTLFTLYLFVLLVRVLLPAVRADYHNPFSQFIVKLTEPLIAPLQKILPHTDRFDTAAVMLLLLFAWIKIWLIFGVLLNAHVFWLGSFLLAIAQLLEMLVQFYFFSILIQAIMSWVQPNSYNPFSTILFQLNEPLLAPARRYIPPIAGLDLSPLAVIIILQIISIVILRPLTLFALQLTVGLVR